MPSLAHHPRDDLSQLATDAVALRHGQRLRAPWNADLFGKRLTGRGCFLVDLSEDAAYGGRRLLVLSHLNEGIEYIGLHVAAVAHEPLPPLR